jgi:hypothetical protein
VRPASCRSFLFVCRHLTTIDNQESGDLESFLGELIDDAPLWHWAEQATQQAKRHDAQFKQVHVQKAKMHAWLAWQDRPGMSLGSSIRAGRFSKPSPNADAFVAWFQRLFFDD